MATLDDAEEARIKALKATKQSQMRQLNATRETLKRGTPMWHTVTAARLALVAELEELDLELGRRTARRRTVEDQARRMHGDSFPVLFMSCAKCILTPELYQSVIDAAKDRVKQQDESANA